MNEFAQRQVKHYLDSLGEIIGKQGCYMTQITVFGNRIETGLPAMAPIVIPPVFMASDEAKDQLVETVLPEIARTLKKEMTVSAVVWGSEIWLRKIPIAEAGKLKDYKEIPITGEGVAVVVDHDGPTENYLYDIHRTGMKVTVDGEMIDEIHLTLKEITKEKHPSTGRFSGLFKLFRDA